MKLEKLIGERFRERPADCVIDSHALMVKGGYMKYMANGIYSSYLPLKRITHKIEQILREEMDKLDGQEVSFPVVMPASLWEESGRYESVGEELLRFTDRNNAKMVLGMTHEEAAVHLVREYAKSYNKYPFMIYQIQTKFRDEARPRAGLIRVREFTMKDAYSFHTSQEDLNQYYEKCHKAYERIFERAGIPEVVSVASDSGMMGGSLSHEFMLLTPVGEDSIVLCNECDFRANMEAAENISDIARDAVSAELEKVHTPDIHTIEDICKFFGDETCNSCKAVVYQKNLDDTYVVVFIRGDLEINETKLVNYLKDEIHPAIITEECGLNAGYIGPVGLKINGDAIVLYDRSLENRNNLSCGANEDEYHYKGLDMQRDVPDAEYHDFAKAYEGGICPKCGYGKNGEWRPSIAGACRTGGGCPACSGKVLVEGVNDVATVHPEIAAQWHPTLNEFPPTRVTSGSAKHVYLVCKDCGYGASGEWHPMIAFACGSGEVHTGCPECARNSLRKVMRAHYAKTARKPVVSVACPQIAALWHPDNEFGPDMYTTGSCKNIPLVCPVCGYGKEKDWTPSIADVCRKGAKCPFCGNTVR